MPAPSATLWAEQLWRELRLSLRRLAATPVFTIFAVGSLAIGVGTTTAFYASVYDAIWPAGGVRDLDRVFYVLASSSGRASWTYAVARGDFEDLRVSAAAVADLGAWTSTARPYLDGIRFRGLQRGSRNRERVLHRGRDDGIGPGAPAAGRRSSRIVRYRLSATPSGSASLAAPRTSSDARCDLAGDPFRLWVSRTGRFKDLVRRTSAAVSTAGSRCRRSPPWQVRHRPRRALTTTRSHRSRCSGACVQTRRWPASTPPSRQQGSASTLRFPCVIRPDWSLPKARPARADGRRCLSPTPLPRGIRRAASPRSSRWSAWSSSSPARTSRI